MPLEVWLWNTSHSDEYISFCQNILLDNSKNPIPFTNANLTATIRRGKDGARLQMKLVYNDWAPVVLFLLQRMDCSSMCLLPRLNLCHILVYEAYTNGRPRLSTHGRKTTIMDFYGVILPSLKRLYSILEELRGCSNVDRGICLEPCTKIVLPNCCHAMCIKCYRNWNTKSESCPFCQGSLKWVNSEDLWVLTCDNDVVDTKTISKDYLDTLPKDYLDVLFLVYYEYLF
ncbi:hypothetical protein K2173_011286 [Erythroxylum novogranatense]|uniref:RING-type domain-containing protein n=1 Tax=Erythroxylum novogranatense TaxID=1862640 RepID=A0AAV8S9C2_9ROSI|nr:hypothetical protein K2173_011286 [Erythroxylum novogranatense]